MNKEKELIYRKRMKIGTILAGLLAITHKNVAQSSEYKRPVIPTSVARKNP